MIDPRELMRLHVEALFTLDDSGRLVVVNDPGRAPAPRFFFGGTPQGNAWWFRHDVGAALAADLEALCVAWPSGLDADDRAGMATACIERLAREEPVQRTWTGPAFLCPSSLPGDEAVILVTRDNETVLSPYLEDWRPDVAAGTPLVAALDDGKAVSVCGSVRVTPRAHEAGVETHREFRGRGHGARAVRAWAKMVRDRDRLPLYSTSWANVASLALARKIGLVQFGSDFHIT